MSKRQKKMLKKQNNLIKYFEFSNLSKFKNLSHGIFSRNGGRSKSPYNSLNIGFNVGDDKNDVYYNLDLILNIMNCKGCNTKKLHFISFNDLSAFLSPERA